MVYLKNKSSLQRPTKQLLQILADCCLIAASFLVAMALRLDNFAFLATSTPLRVLLPIIPLTIAAFARFGLYRTVVRYITVGALRGVFFGVCISAVSMSVLAHLLSIPVPRSVPGIFAILLFLSVGGMRFVARDYFRRLEDNGKKYLLIYGAGSAGRQLVNALHQGREYRPVAFIDDDPKLQDTVVSGLKVHSPAKIRSVAERLEAEVILIAMPSITRARRREIIGGIEPLGLEVKTIPGIADIVSGKASFAELRAVSPEDLLGRDPIAPHPELLSANIAGKVVLVTGAGGSIGSELCRQIAVLGADTLVLLDNSEFALYTIDSELRQTIKRNGLSLRLTPILGSVQDEARVRAVLQAFGVRTVYHAAAYKHVPLVEENVIEGVRNNVLGTRTVVEACIAAGVERLIVVSTDKAVRPTNIMGASKRMAELVCQAASKKAPGAIISMVRFGNVLGSSGSVIPLFREQIEHGGPVTVTHREITRYFMTIPEAAQLVIQAGAMAQGGDVFVLDMGEPVRILDLATSMVRMHGLTPYIVEEGGHPQHGDIPIVITGLREGEKLYEELLIGDNPTETEHPRIMTANEISLDAEALDAVLERLERACATSDILAIRQIFIDAPLGYLPTSDRIADLMWRENEG